MPTLYQKIGGYRPLQKIVAQFYQNILNDERVCDFYLQNVSDIPKLHNTMAQYLTFLFGGPNNYKGPDLHTLHKHMPIKQIHYEITWQHMQKAFLGSGLDGATVREIKDVVYHTKKDIVTAL